MVNTGIRYNLISLLDLVSINKLPLLRPDHKQLTIPNGPHIDVIGVVELKVKIANCTYDLLFHVVTYNIKHIMLSRSGLKIVFPTWISVFTKKYYGQSNIS